MKEFLKRHKRTIYIFLLLLTTASYLIIGNSRRASDAYVAKKMQEQIQSDEALLDAIFVDLQEYLLVNGKETYQRKSLDYQKKYEDRFAFVLYEDGELELWTDNHIDFPEHVEEITNNPLQQFGSYQVLIRKKEFHHFTLIATHLIRLQYPWQNEYLINHVGAYFNTPGDLNIGPHDGVPVENAEGNILFYIQSNSSQNNNALNLIPFILFLLSFYFLGIILQEYLRGFENTKPRLGMFIYMLLMFSWYALHVLFDAPEQIFHSKLFSPELYACFGIYNSLGNLFFVSLLLIFVVIYYFKHIPRRDQSVWFIYIYSIIIMALYYGLISLIRSLVFDSQILLNLYQLAALNVYSYLVLWIIFIFQLSWFLLAYRWLGYFVGLKKGHVHFWLIILFSFLIPVFYHGIFEEQIWYFQVAFNILLIMIFYLQNRQSKGQRIGEILLYFIILTFSTTSFLNELNGEKENIIRETSALTLDLDNDPFLEEQFLSSIQEIQSDERLRSLTRNMGEEGSDVRLLNLISEEYFASFMQLYNVSLIQCDESSLITVLPENFETSCYSYFRERLENAESIIKKDTLYLIKGSFQYRNYIGRIPLEIDSITNSSIFIEFVSRTKPKEMGLPAILEKSHIYQSPLQRNYSYAIYNKGILTEWYGKFDYKQKLSDYRLNSYHHYYFERNEYQHYVYSKNDENVLIISLEEAGVLQELASFAFIFLYFSLLVFLLYTFFNYTSLQNSISSFQGRMQYSMILLLIFSFILIGVSSLYYIIYLNHTKNADNLMEKAHSVLIELEHKLSDMNELAPQDHEYVESLLVKFSEVFFTDITLYNKKGEILASSRPEMFSAALLSARMDAQAFYELNFLKNSFFIHEEKIGTQKYLSAYLPFRNQDNKSVAYLNLPYFAKQYELEEEVSGFIVAFLNIYLFLLFITIIITIIISRYLSKPLQMIKEKIRKLDFQNANEKIEWHKNDEIGDLIKEYNRMIDELNTSAQKLALSQRESAWREMAQQIAHEIKNPLTPMKLNVQYLEKAWDDGVEDYEVRMKRITKGLQEQIEVLAEIANQFSSFAEIDKIYPQKMDLRSTIDGVEALFRENTHIQFSKECEKEPYFIQADKNQMIRVFNNLYKNAVQAIGVDHKGHIFTSLQKKDGKIIIRIHDDGCGIPANELPRIFEPRFTTKTGGMGLGLALVKKMLENAGGCIQAESIEHDGSHFIIEIPED